MASGEAGMGADMEGDVALSDEAVEEERQHFQKIANAFLYYKWAGLLHLLMNYSCCDVTCRTSAQTPDL